MAPAALHQCRCTRRLLCAAAPRPAAAFTALRRCACRPGGRQCNLPRGVALHDLCRPGAVQDRPKRWHQPLVQVCMCGRGGRGGTGAGQWGPGGKTRQDGGCGALAASNVAARRRECGMQTRAACLARPCRRMWQDPRFSGGAAQRWAQLRAGPWSDATIARMFAETTAQVCAERARFHTVHVFRASRQHAAWVAAGWGCSWRRIHRVPLPCLPPCSPARSSRRCCATSTSTQPCCSSPGTAARSRSGPQVRRCSGLGTPGCRWCVSRGAHLGGAGGAMIVLHPLPHGLQRCRTCRAGCPSTWPGWMASLPSRRALLARRRRGASGRPSGARARSCSAGRTTAH